MKTTLDSINTRLLSLERDFDVSEHDIWTERGRSQAEQEGFKRSLAKYYKRKSIWRMKQLKCMITDEWHDYSDVIASHIWMASEGRLLYKFNLAYADLYSPRNGFLVLKDIENAFDRKHLCFLYNPYGDDAGKFRIKVLDPVIVDMVITHSAKKFQDIDGAFLQCSLVKTPFKRILGFHARYSYRYAVSKGWLHESDVFPEYFNIQRGQVLVAHNTNEFHILSPFAYNSTCKSKSIYFNIIKYFKVTIRMLLWHAVKYIFACLIKSVRRII